MKQIKTDDIVIDFSSEREMKEYIDGHKLARHPYSKKLKDKEYLKTGDSEGRRESRGYKLKKMLAKFTMIDNGDEYFAH